MRPIVVEAVSFVFGDRATVPGFLGSNVQDRAWGLLRIAFF